MGFFLRTSSVLNSLSVNGLFPRGGGGSPYSVLYGEAPPARGTFFKLAVYKRVGKIAILVYERVTKSAEKWKKW